MDFFLCFIKKNWYYIVIVFLLLSVIGTTFYFLEFDVCARDRGEFRQSIRALDANSDDYFLFLAHA